MSQPQSDAKRFDATMVGALRSRWRRTPTRITSGALAEAGWSEKEIMVVLDDEAPSRSTLLAHKVSARDQSDAKPKRRERGRNANEANSRSRLPNFTEYTVS